MKNSIKLRYRGVTASIVGLALSASVTNVHSALIWQSSLDGNGDSTTGADATKFGDPAPIADLNTNADGALEFDGTGDYYTIDPAPVASFEAASISIWIRPDVVDDAERGIVGIGASGGGTDKYFTVMNMGDMKFRCDLDDGGTRLDVKSDAVPTVGTWLHLVVTFDASSGGSNELRMYIDGVLQTELQAIPVGSYAMSNTWVFGGERVNSRLWIGGQDDLRIYNHELAQGEVTDLYLDGPMFGDLPNPDADMDGLPAVWEDAYGLDDNDDGSIDINNGPLGDPDSDFSDNLDEFTRGTIPNDPDTDNDTLLDGHETGTGNYVDPTDTGTSPLLADTDGDTLDDNIENDSGIYNGPTDTGTSPFLVDTDGDGLTDDVENNSGDFNGPTDPGSNPNIPDTDGGGNPDGWEASYGLDPTTDTDEQADPDGDTLGADVEYGLGTNPIEADTDFDGLRDDYETDTGNYVDPTNTGTSPINPDDDNDLLLDGVETDTGIFTNPDDTGSDPFDADSDNDGIPDFGEVARGINPNVDTETPDVASILFLGSGNDGALGFADPAFRNYLEQLSGAANVDYLKASDSAPGDENAYDLLVISSSIISGDARNKFQNSTVGLVNWEEAIADSGNGEFQQTDVNMVKLGGVTDVEILDNSHPITEIYAPFEIVNILDPGAEISASNGTLGILGAGVTALAGVGIDNGLFVTDIGGALLGDGSVERPATAAGRRVHLPMTDMTFNNITGDGLILFTRSLDWAAGLIDPPAPAIVITNFVVDPGADTATITFESSDTANYAADYSGTLDPVNWQEVPGSSTPGAAGTTDIVISGVTATYGATQFFRIREE